MFEAAYNTINERIDQFFNPNRNEAVQFQSPKINFINDTVARKPDGSPDPQFVSSIHCAYAIKRIGSDTSTSVHLYFSQQAGKVNYRVVFSSKTAFAGSYGADKPLDEWVDSVLKNVKLYAFVIARFMNMSRD